MRKNNFRNKHKFHTRIKNDVKVNFEEEKQVILQFSLAGVEEGTVLTCRPVFLITDNGKKIPLVICEGMSFAGAPVKHDRSGRFNFTFVFSGLPVGCKVFSVSLEDEIIHENITRNKTDAYKIYM